MAQQKSTLGSKSDFRLTTTGQCLHCTGSFSCKGTVCHFEHIPPHQWEIKENSSPAQSQNSLGSFVECYTSSRQCYLHVSPAATHYEFLVFFRISHLYFTTIYVTAHNRAIFFVHKYKKDIKLYLNIKMLFFQRHYISEGLLPIPCSDQTPSHPHHLNRQHLIHVSHPAFSFSIPSPPRSVRILLRKEAVSSLPGVIWRVRCLPDPLCRRVTSAEPA